jgi:hypothetical protein
VEKVAMATEFQQAAELVASALAKLDAGSVPTAQEVEALRDAAQEWAWAFETEAQRVPESLWDRTAPAETDTDRESEPALRGAEVVLLALAAVAFVALYLGAAWYVVSGT